MSVPLVTRKRGKDTAEVVFDGDEEMAAADAAAAAASNDTAEKELTPWAHRDIKPACALLLSLITSFEKIH